MPAPVLTASSVAHVGSSRPLGPQLRKTEIQNLQVPIGPDHDVFRLDVAMDDARGVRGGETGGGLKGQVDHLARRKATRRQALTKRPAVDELGGEIVCPAGAADLVNRQDVRMIRAPTRLWLRA